MIHMKIFDINSCNLLEVNYKGENNPSGTFCENVKKNFVDKYEECGNKGSGICYLIINDKFKKNHLENKKKLFEFLEYYNIVRDKINNSEESKRKPYCDYINYYFYFYKEMLKKYNVSCYIKEINSFKKKFWGRTRQLTFLNNKCPNRRLNLVFTNQYKNAETLEKDKNYKNNKGSSSCETTEKTNLFAINDGDENILRNLDEYKTYKSLNENNFYDFHEYCKKMKTFDCDCPGVNDLCNITMSNLINLSSRSNAENRDKRYEKDLHDYFNNIATIKEKFSPTNDESRKHCKYLNKIIRLTEELIEPVYIDGHVQWLSKKSMENPKFLNWGNTHSTSTSVGTNSNIAYDHF
ncbi:PIR Superfamily Protein [Plasmodium ovale curtisi]|uniref:PIR Superfamily Protein n=1 Tax=Plasmodium ovale curtisi TaxID=864141 RepID=A0A1A8WJR5_PLAOA|nr:PIR Superfamily Protein [Plasmodium ovale curtisi]